ncbi:MAG: hypothetical protein HUK14_05615 [Muribaculaceae bacterium]|nr:hypothetical protein [Muribaculaceae bacterium]
MSKKLITLNEDDLSNIVREVLNEALEEVTLQQASVGGIYNILAMDDINQGNGNVTFGSQNKPSVERLEKSNDKQWQLLSKAIVDIMGNFRLYFVQPGSGIGHKVINLCFTSILSLGNNGFILYGKGRVSGYKMVNGQLRENFKQIKIFYDHNKQQYSWINTYSVNNERYIRVTAKKNILLPKGDSNELLENKINEQNLFACINQYVALVNAQLPQNLQLTIKL